MTEREEHLLILLGIVAGIYILTKEAPEAIKVVKAIKEWITPDTGKQFESSFDSAEIRFGLPKGMLSRVAYQESRYNPNIVNTKSGAQGLMQFMPATAKDIGVDPFDPYEAISGAAQYLKSLYKQFGSWTLALAAYNWGPGNLKKKGIANAPSETKTYYSSILRDIGLA